MNWTGRIDKAFNEKVLHQLETSPLGYLLDMAQLKMRAFEQKLNPDNAQDAVFIALRDFMDYISTSPGKEAWEKECSGKQYFHDRTHSHISHLDDAFCNAVGNLYVEHTNLDMSVDVLNDVLSPDKARAESAIAQAKADRDAFLRQFVSPDTNYQELHVDSGPDGDPNGAYTMSRFEVMEESAHMAGYQTGSLIIEGLSQKIEIEKASRGHGV